MVTTRMRNTAFKKSLKEIPLGTKIIIQGPKGSFVLRKNSHRPAVFLAGGIGVTPFRSIIKYAVDKKLRHEIYLFYSNRTQKLAAFLEDLEGWQSEDRNFRLIPTVTEEKGNGWKYEIGKIDEKMLRKHLGRDFSNGVYYVAGPPDMVSDMNQFLVKIGVNEASIESDGFDGY
jgi:NAD(P)H-flavin reductase